MVDVKHTADAAVKAKLRDNLNAAADEVHAAWASIPHDADDAESVRFAADDVRRAASALDRVAAEIESETEQMALPL
jgi:hypothetical protein